MEQGAQVKFGAVDLLAKDVTTYVNRRGVVGRDGRIDWALGLMNDGNTISENVTNLMGDGSYADTKTVTIGVVTKRKTLQLKLFTSVNTLKVGF